MKPLATRTLSHTFLTPHPADPAEALNRGPEIFAVQIGDVEAIFSLSARRAIEEKPAGTRFTWKHLRGFALPSMIGEVVVRRLGPLTGITVRACYGYDSGASGRLFHESIGAGLAQKTFEKLVESLRALVTSAARGATS